MLEGDLCRPPWSDYERESIKRHHSVMVSEALAAFRISRQLPRPIVAALHPITCVPAQLKQIENNNHILALTHLPESSHLAASVPSMLRDLAVCASI